VQVAPPAGCGIWLVKNSEKQNLTTHKHTHTKKKKKKKTFGRNLKPAIWENLFIFGCVFFDFFTKFFNFGNVDGFEEK
jgi:hypothetical protein